MEEAIINQAPSVLLAQTDIRESLTAKHKILDSLVITSTRTKKFITFNTVHNSTTASVSNFWDNK